MFIHNGFIHHCTSNLSEVNDAGGENPFIFPNDAKKPLRANFRGTYICDYPITNSVTVNIRPITASNQVLEKEEVETICISN